MTPELSQRLSQELRLTPQLLELVKILQLPRLELQQLIRHEIEMNPFLTEELIEEEDEDIKEIPEEQEAEMPRSDEIDYEYFFHDDWSRTGYDFAKKSSEDDEFNPVDIYSQPMTLRDHLLRQIHLQFNDAVEVLIGEFVTDSLSDEGLLDVSINEIAESLKVETELIEAVLKKYRFLEPVGIGSKDTRECLLTQLEFVNKTESLEYTLLRDFYDDFITNKIYKIEAKLKISSGRLENAIDEIKKLNPKPANGEWDKTSNYVIPDVIIERKGDELIPNLNTTNFPELHLNKKNMEMLKTKIT